MAMKKMKTFTINGEHIYEIVDDYARTSILNGSGNGSGNTIYINDLYVTPEMFGAKGDGVTDDSAAIQQAIDKCMPVYFDNKTYLCKDIITKRSENVILIGSGSSVVKWNITTTEGLREACGMISDDDSLSTSYLEKGTVHIDGIIFDGNANNITDFPITDCLGLCVFFARDLITIKNCTFRNCHSDGLFVGGLKDKVNISNCKFENIGLWQPTDGTRNGMTLSRNYWDRGQFSTISNDNNLIGIVENCSFYNIADECARVDGFSIFEFKNCTFKEIGHFILETGHKTDKTPYCHTIDNCIGSFIGSGIYNSGADGGGEFTYEGTIIVKNSRFDNLIWVGSTAKLKRPNNAYLIDGYTTGIKPDIFIENSKFISITEGLTTCDNSNFIVGRNVTLNNVDIDYQQVNTTNVFSSDETFKIIDCNIRLNKTSSDSIFITLKNDNLFDLKDTVFDLPKLYVFTRCYHENLKLNVQSCTFKFNEAYVLFEMCNEHCKNAEFRIVNNIMTGSLTGCMIFYEVTDGTQPKTAFVHGNDVIPTFIKEWGKVTNLEAVWNNYANNRYGISQYTATINQIDV